MDGETKWTHAKLTRRTTLKWLGLGTAGAFLAGCGGAAAPTAAPAATTKPAAAGTTAPAAAATSAPAAAAPTAAAKVTPAAKTINISFATTGTVEVMGMFDNICADFEKKNPNIKVERMLDPALSWEKIATMLAGGTAKSVNLINNDDTFRFTYSGMITVLDDYIKRDLKKEDYYPMTWKNLVGPGDVVAGMIWGASTRLNFVNTDHLKEAGVEIPTSWEKAWDFKTFDAMLNKLAKKDASGKTTRYAYLPNNTTCTTFGDNWGAVRYNANETECLYGSEHTVKAWTWLQDIFCKRKVAPPPTEDMWALFNSGLVSMVTDKIQYITRIKAGVNWDVAPQFFGDAPAGTAKNYTESPEVVYAIPTSEKEKDAAWELAKWFWTEPGQTVFSKMAFAIPTLKKVAESVPFGDPKTFPKNGGIIAPGLAYDCPTQSLNPMGDDWQKYWGRNWTEVTGCQKEPKQYVDEAVKAINQKIKDTGWDKSKNWVKGWKP